MHFTCVQVTDYHDYDFIFKHTILAQLTHFNMHTESINMLKGTFTHAAGIPL